MPQLEPWAIYVRISKAQRKTEDGRLITETLGVERQEPPCRALVQRHGGRVHKVYTDNDVSAYSNRKPRPAFARMMADARAGVVKGIAVWDADRLTRKPVENEDVIDLAEQLGLKLATVTGEYDLSTSTGRLHFRIRGAVARHEVEHMSERWVEKKLELAVNGRPAGGGKRRYGFEKDGVTVIEHEAEILREAGRRVLAGEPINALCRDFNDRDLRMADGKSLWQPTALRRILLQPRTAGLRGHGGQGMEVMRDANGDPVTLKDKQGRDVEKILDVGTWTRLGTVLRDPDRRKPGHPHEYLLSGIPTCRNCGKGKLYGRTPKDRGVSYLCSAKNLGCYLRIDGDGLDAYVTRHAIDWLCGDGLVRAREQLAVREADHEATKAQLATDEAKLLELADAYAADEIDLPSMLRARKPIEARITKAKAKLEQVPRLAVVADLPSTRRKLTAAWKRMPVASKRAILKAIIARFEVGPGTPGRHKFDESRVTLVFIDREQPGRKITWPISHDAGERDMFQETDLPHETDPAVLDMVAREMEKQ